MSVPTIGFLQFFVSFISNNRYLISPEKANVGQIIQLIMLLKLFKQSSSICYLKKNALICSVDFFSEMIM